MKVDLHSHTNYSDGFYSPSEVIKRAKENNVDVLAITDHDNADGVLEAIKVSKDYNIKVIPGIELTTYFNDEAVHIIGLFKNDYVPKEIKEYSQQMKSLRKSRALKMLYDIKQFYNINIDFSLLDDLNITTRGNMIQIIQQSNKDVDEKQAISYVSKDSRAYVSVAKYSVKEGIEFLRKNNCLVILAHPTLLHDYNYNEIIKYDFDGIEARYPKNKPGEEEKYTSLALNRGMFISAGSDFHGDGTHASLGFSSLDENEYKIIKMRLEE